MTLEDVYERLNLAGKDCLVRREKGWQGDVPQLHKDILIFDEKPIIIIESGVVVETYNGFSFIEDKGILKKIGRKID